MEFPHLDQQRNYLRQRYRRFAQTQFHSGWREPKWSAVSFSTVSAHLRRLRVLSQWHFRPKADLRQLIKCCTAASALLPFVNHAALLMDQCWHSGKASHVGNETEVPHSHLCGFQSFCLANSANSIGNCSIVGNFSKLCLAGVFAQGSISLV